DEAVELRTPFSAEENILAKYSADPVALTEVEPVTHDEILLQETGRDLRPDTVTPAPDITSTGAAAVEYAEDLDENGISLEEIAASEEARAEAAPADALETTTSALETENAASNESNDNVEKQDASPDAAK
ncbi:MAG TPA: hypothetical protein VFH31_06295, partial [Pyrinomonadaceae bacterium]|nr:hypothetical protein [Pyrinomonadaceae bacterium]